MGGQSFKCPLCDVWKLIQGPLKEHAKAKHAVELDFSEGGPYPAVKPPIPPSVWKPKD